MKTLDDIEGARKKADDERKRSLLIHRTIVVVETLENTEAELKRLEAESNKMLENIKALTGLELWRTGGKDNAYFWWDGKRESVKYRFASSAVRALANNKIDWKG